METIAIYAELTEMDLDLVTGGNDAGAPPDGGAPPPSGGGVKTDGGAGKDGGKEGGKTENNTTKKVELGLEAGTKSPAKPGENWVTEVKATFKAIFEWK